MTFFENKTRSIKKINICESSLLDFISNFRFFESVEKIVNQIKPSKSNKMIGSLKLVVFWLDGKETIKCQCQSITMPFFENRRNCPGFDKKSQDCVHLWVKFSI